MKKNIIKVKKYQKPLICLIGILILFVGIAIGKFMNAKADNINYEYQSLNIDYDNSISNLNATNVKDAIDELYSKVGKCPNGIYCYVKNKSFEKAYVYDESVCITGDESGCIETTCYENGNCPVGTIIDYAVSSSDVVRFHVLHDDGDTMTMQTQRNTVYGTRWYEGPNDTTKGPTAIMTALKTATDGWTNVSLINITESTTSFTGVNSIDNSCMFDSEGNVTCSGNLYDIKLIANTYRARMITTQESVNPNIGQCLAYIDHSKPNSKTCRLFMNNFLDDSVNHCKNVMLCVNDNYVTDNWGYWTMGVRASATGFTVTNSGNISYDGTASSRYGARAVVVVNK